MIDLCMPNMMHDIDLSSVASSVSSSPSLSSVSSSSSSSSSEPPPPPPPLPLEPTQKQTGFFRSMFGNFGFNKRQQEKEEAWLSSHRDFPDDPEESMMTMIFFDVDEDPLPERKKRRRRRRKRRQRRKQRKDANKKAAELREDGRDDTEGLSQKDLSSAHSDGSETCLTSNLTVIEEEEEDKMDEDGIDEGLRLLFEKAIHDDTTSVKTERRAPEIINDEDEDDDSTRFDDKQYIQQPRLTNTPVSSSNPEDYDDMLAFFDRINDGIADNELLMPALENKRVISKQDTGSPTPSLTLSATTNSSSRSSLLDQEETLVDGMAGDESVISYQEDKLSDEETDEEFQQMVNRAMSSEEQPKGDEIECDLSNETSSDQNQNQLAVDSSQQQQEQPHSLKCSGPDSLWASFVQLHDVVDDVLLKVCSGLGHEIE